MNTFTLSIALGNDAMQTAQDVAEALRRVATTLDGATPRLVQEQGIRDLNGNTVGKWVLS